MTTCKIIYHFLEQSTKVTSTCALLEVPLDYSNASIGTVNLAVIKKPGESEDAQEVLLNPGGPGGSSVAAVRVDYEAVQNKIGKQYALIGIDPRGVISTLLYEVRVWN